MIFKDFIKLLVIKIPYGFSILNFLGIKKDFEVNTFLKQISRGDIIYDIGANRGRFTKLFSLLSGKDGRVIAFDPVQTNIDNLNILSRKFPQIEVHKIAVSDISENTNIYLPENDSAQSSLIKQSFGNWKVAEKILVESCRTEPLDEYISEKNIPPPNFIKIDAEGAEYKIINGAEKLIKKYSPTIFLELNQPTMEKFNTSGKQILNRLEELGYCVFQLITLEGIFTVNKNNLEDFLGNHFSPNLLALK